MSEAHPPIQIVNEHDKPLRGGTMDEVQLQGLWHRVAGVMVEDTQKNKYLLQKIAPNPYYSGGKWNISATGHVDNGESYLEAATRELCEEMGVKGLSLVKFDYYVSSKTSFRAGHDRTYNRFYTIFTAEADPSLVVVEPNRDEVEDVHWASRRELLDMYDNNPEIMDDTLKKFVERIVNGD